MIYTHALLSPRSPFDVDPSSIYQRYTRQTCVLECKLRLAHASCNCTPWDLPKAVAGPGGKISVCDHQGTSCFQVWSSMYDVALFMQSILFQEAMNERSKCDCPADCDMVSYAVQVEEGPLDAGALCRNPGIHRSRRCELSLL